MYAWWGERWTADDIAELVIREQGLSDWHAINCVAVALAESGGWTQAVNLVDNDPDDRAYLSLDLGLWQVNTYWHPDLPIRDSFTPSKQLAYVLSIAKKRNAWGYDWTLWTSWRNGAARDELGEARHAVNRVRDSMGQGPI